MEPLQCYTIDGLRKLLEEKGPLWVCAAVPSLHAVVVTGMYSDGSVGNTFVRVSDPWPPGQGSQYVRSLRRFAEEYEGVSDFPSVSVQVLHAESGPI